MRRGFQLIMRIRVWPRPESAEQLRSFVGLAGYYRRFVPGFSKSAAPLHAMLPPVNQGKGKPAREVRTFTLNQEAQEAFEQLKGALCEAPVLAYPNFTAPFVLEIDASLKGLGACLSQVGGDGCRHLVAYASRGLRGAEINLLP